MRTTLSVFGLAAAASVFFISAASAAPAAKLYREIAVDQYSFNAAQLSAVEALRTQSNGLVVGDVHTVDDPCSDAPATKLIIGFNANMNAAEQASLETRIHESILKAGSL